MPKANRNNQRAVNEGVERLQMGHHPQAWVKGFKPFQTNTPGAAIGRWQKYAGLVFLLFMCGLLFLFPLLAFGELWGLLMAQNFVWVAVVRHLTQSQVIALIFATLVGLMGVFLLREVGRIFLQINEEPEDAEDIEEED